MTLVYAPSQEGVVGQQADVVDVNGATKKLNILAVVQVGATGTPVGATAPLPVTSGTPTTLTATIANGASLSDAVAISGKLVGLVVPAAWTAASLTFQGSVDGVNFYNVYDDATERTIASASVVASHYIALTLTHWLGFTHIKVRSGTASAAVNQGAARSIILALAG